MYVIKARNVHQALPEACYQLQQQGVVRATRNGTVIAFPTPVTTVYARPSERVIFWKDRDANPFFHFFESLWMLAGRNDVAFVEVFAKNMRNYSDDGEVLHGAYGHRWRAHFGFDQLTQVAQSLKKDPTCRRQVVQMWDARADLSRDSKDLPCNTQIYFQINHLHQLDMMVTNRSNDLIWGAYGANAVHFSVLQEFMASYIGVDLGTYYQTSMNTHVYWDTHGPLCDQMALRAPMPPAEVTCPYTNQEVISEPIMSISVNRWKRELSTFMQWGPGSTYADPFFESVAKPMLIAWTAHTKRDYPAAYAALIPCRASDWSMACNEWLLRREVKWISKS